MKELFVTLNEAKEAINWALDNLDAKEHLVADQFNILTNALVRVEEELSRQKNKFLSKEFGRVPEWVESYHNFGKEITTSKDEKINLHEQLKKHATAFLDDIRDYESENGGRICLDERTSEELYDIFIAEEPEWLEIFEDGMFKNKVLKSLK